MFAAFAILNYVPTLMQAAVESTQASPPSSLLRCGITHQPMPARSNVSRISQASVGAQAGELPPADTLSEPTIIDVMFLYTPQALAAEGSADGIRRRVLESVDSTNLRLTNSLINVLIDVEQRELVPGGEHRRRPLLTEDIHSVSRPDW